MKPILFFVFIALAMASGLAVADLAEDRMRADALLADGEEKKALKAYENLGRAGDHDAQYLVSVFYAQGRGTKQDLVEAYGWSVLAAEAGLDKLDRHSAELYAMVDEGKRKKADKKANSLVRKYGKEALEVKAKRLSERGAGRSMGSCTGSRLNCRGATNSTYMPAVGPGAPPQPSGGN
jgi:TPR repeat protein